jgi:hypothetical protein
MTTLFARESLFLGCGKTSSGTAAKATVVRISRGQVWLTVAGELTDYWLNAGEIMTVPARCLVVIEAANGDAQVDIVPHRKPLFGWLRRKSRTLPIACIARPQH